MRASKVFSFFFFAFVPNFIAIVFTVYSLRVWSVEHLDVPENDIITGSHFYDSATDSYVKRSRSLIGDIDTGAKATVSHFRALKTSPTIRVLGGNFGGSSLDSVRWTESSTGNGTTSVSDGVLTLSVTGGTGVAAVQSDNDGLFISGQVTTFQTGIIQTQSSISANTRVRFGTFNSTDGTFVEIDSGDTYIVWRKGGVDTRIASANWNGQSVSSLLNSNTTIRLYYSAGRFYWEFGNKLAHDFRTTAANPIWTNNLNLPIRYEAETVSGSNTVSFKVRGSSVSIFGTLDTSRLEDLATEVSTGSPVTIGASVIIGKDPDNTYRATGVNEWGALDVTDFFFDVSRGKFSGISTNVAFGNNDDIDTTSTPEDIWANGGTYTGFPTGSAETIECFSSDANDTAAGTGARTARLTGLDANFDIQTVDISLNGTSATTTAETWSRMNMIQVLTAGSGGENAGTITCRHSSTTANVFAVVPAGNNQSTIGAFTVPNGKTGYIRRIRLSMGRNNGSAGSGLITIRSRPENGVFNGIRRETLTTNSPVQYGIGGSIILTEKTDVKFKIESVSDNNTQIAGAIEYVLIDN